MEHSSVTVESVGNLKANGKHLLEDLLGRQLQDHQQVFIMVLSPGSEPDEGARRQARLTFASTFQKTAADAVEHAISDDEIDAAIQEAGRQIHPRNNAVVAYIKTETPLPPT
jgi:hypothetical protein